MERLSDKCPCNMPDCPHGGQCDYGCEKYANWVYDVQKALTAYENIDLTTGDAIKAVRTAEQKRDCLFYRQIKEMLSKQDVFVEFTDMKEVGTPEKPDEGMRGRLLAIEDFEGNESGSFPELHVSFDLSGFESHNKAVASHDWRNKDGIPHLTWFESGYYPEDGKIDYYLFGDLDSEVTIFRPIEIGCEYCNGELAVLDQNGILVLVDNKGNLEIFVDGKSEASAAAHIQRCPHCGRSF